MSRKYKKESKIYTKRQVVNSKTPMDFIHRCLYSKLNFSEKQQASKEWRERTGYTVDDIKYARHRHPYWKAKKKEGYEKRYIERTQKYTYFHTVRGRTPYKRWSIDEIYEFVELNVQQKNGRYTMCDRELAKHFGISIQVVQYLRRKINCSIAILNKLGKKCTKKAIAKTTMASEHILRNQRKQLS